MESANRTLRETVEKMWALAEKIENTGATKQIPSVEKTGDLRHAMKAELIYHIYDVIGFENTPNTKQVLFLQEVLHAPINEANKEDFADRMKKFDFVKKEPIMPYLALIDRANEDTGLSTGYMMLTTYMLLYYIKEADSAGIDVLLNFYTLIKKQIKIIEAASGKEVDFDPLGSVDIEKREKIRAICELMDKSDDDESFKNMLKAIREAIDRADDNKSNDEFSGFIKETKIDNNKEEKDEEPEQKESKIDARAELNKLIGLEEVKNEVNSLLNLVKVRLECEKKGIHRQPMSYHMVFKGNPGTGKTTVARLMGQIYHEMGLLSKGHLIEASRADLVAEYVGHTAKKVKELVKKAKGGVLFIDEAYALVSHSDSDFGHEAIETLLKEMEDNRDDLIVIVAGYPKLMDEFINSNPGLSSRFSKTIYFSDYSCDELVEIFRKYCRENRMRMAKGVSNAVKEYFEMELKLKDKNFGNARMVRNFFEQIQINQANRLADDEDPPIAVLNTIKLEDIPRKFMIKQTDMFTL